MPACSSRQRRLAMGLSSPTRRSSDLAASLKAASASANLAASSSVANNCTISTAALAFGAYDPVVANASTNLDASGTVSIACTKGATATIDLDLGANATGSTRRLTDGA